MEVRSTGSLGGQIHRYNVTVSLLLMLFFLLQVLLPGFSRLQVVYVPPVTVFTIEKTRI